MLISGPTGQLIKMVNTWGCRILRIVFIFSPMLDTNFMNLGQMAHKLWLLSLFYPIYHFWG